MAKDISKFIVIFLWLATSSAAPKQSGRTIIKIPEECKGKSFCSIKPEGYELLEEKMNSVLPYFLVNEYARRGGRKDCHSKPKLSPKKDWHNCPYVTKCEQAYLYTHGENKTQTEIVVQTELFRQIIETKSCAKKYINRDLNKQCFGDLGLSNFDKKLSCKEHNARHALYVYDDERNNIVEMYVDVPVCCSCDVQYAI